MNQFIILIFFILSCSPNPLNRSIGYKKLKVDTNNKPNIYIEEILIYLNQNGFDDAQKKTVYIENLKKALLVAIYNSGKFKEISFEDIYDKKKDFKAKIKIESCSKSKFFHYPLNKENEEFSILFFPNHNDPDGNSFLWPTIIPVLPYFPITPLLPRSGRAEVSLEFEIFSGKNPTKIILSEYEKFSFLFYGLYRKNEIENLFPILYSRILEKLTLDLLEMK